MEKIIQEGWLAKDTWYDGSVSYHHPNGSFLYSTKKNCEKYGAGKPVRAKLIVMEEEEDAENS